MFGIPVGTDKSIGIVENQQEDIEETDGDINQNLENLF